MEQLEKHLVYVWHPLDEEPEDSWQHLWNLHWTETETQRVSSISQSAADELETARYLRRDRLKYKFEQQYRIYENCEERGLAESMIDSSFVKESVG